MFNKLFSPKATIALFTVLLGALVGLALPGPSAETQSTDQSSTYIQPSQNDNPQNSQNQKGTQDQTAQPAVTNPQGSQDQGNATSDPPPKPSPSDTTFARKAAEGGLAEVELGQLAQERGQSQAVKDFGRRMVRDHSAANDQLKTIATQEGIPLPTTMNAGDRATYDRLSKLSGAAFDQAYARDMVRDHKVDIADFQHEANDGSNTSIKNFASNTVPTLQSHLEQAEQMQNAVSSAASNRTEQVTPSEDFGR